MSTVNVFNTTAYIVIGVGVIIIVLLAVSVLQMRKNKLEPSDWLEHPLGIPTGSVRALLAILLVFVTVWAATAREGSVIRDIPQWLLTIVGAVIGFYFGNRGLSFEKKKETIEEITIARMNRLREMRDRGEITPNVFISEMESIRKGYESLTHTPAPSSGKQPEGSGQKSPPELPSSSA